MRISRAHLADERGITLVELMVAGLVLAVGMLGVATMLQRGAEITVTNTARTGGLNLAREILETARAIDYDNLTASGVASALRARPNLAGSGSPWKVSRRGVTYNVAVTACTYDDPKDGIAATPPAGVCLPQPAAAAGMREDINPDDFRRMTVTLTYNGGQGSRTLTQQTLISNPTGGLGPRIKTLTGPTISASSAAFAATTTTAAALHWQTDAGAGGEAAGGSTDWSIAWDLGPAATPQPASSGNAQYASNTLLDGTYSLTAQPFADRGVAGDTKAIALPLNRSFPITVKDVAGGRNERLGSIDLSWSQNPERDITGYRVYWAGPDGVARTSDDRLVCTTVATSCADSTPPGGTTTYFVVALDRTVITDSTSTPRESTYPAPVTISAAGAKPTTPGLPTLAVVNNLPTLSWTYPNVSNVRFFRIYRDRCCDLADRYDATTGNGTSWSDQAAEGRAHTYWITAADTSFNESEPAGPVTYTP